MFKIYVYVFDTLADWELGYVTAELNSGRFFKKDAPRVSVKTVGILKEPVKTMGGMTIVPDCVIDDIEVNDKSVLLLPGGNTWDNPKHGTIVKKAEELLSVGATVCAICGATVALAHAGLLDQRPHTSNGTGFLEMTCPAYKGQSFYIDKLSVSDHNLITAGAAGALLWTRQIIEHLGVFQSNALDFWYEFFNTGNPQYFFALMQTLPNTEK